MQCERRLELGVAWLGRAFVWKVLAGAHSEGRDIVLQGTALLSYMPPIPVPGQALLRGRTCPRMWSSSVS